jgi:glycosyltransferase involved in cell wall biosynthesis
MYLMATHIPMYVDGDRVFVDDSWYSDLDLSRQFFSPHWGEVHLIGPYLPVSEAAAGHLHEIGPQTENLVLHPSIREDTRVREFWPGARRKWEADLAPLVAEADVVHCSVDDPFRPMHLATLRAGIKADKVTVLIGFDMDVWETLGPKLGQMGKREGAMHLARTAGMDMWMRWCARHASVAMLKEGLVYDRYAPWAKNPKEFCHSMHSDRYLIPDDVFDARMTTLKQGRGIHVGYFGRFIPRKGLTDAVRVVAKARERGVDVTYHLIGEGPQQGELQALAAELGIGEHVVFDGSFPYGEELHAKLRELDALLFTPTEEDTPRMVYDAFAAGLPLLTSDIAFLRRRADRDKASVVFGIGDIEGGADALAGLDRDRERFATLSRVAKEAGKRHSVERWYGERLAWTLEAAERHQRGG